MNAGNAVEISPLEKEKGASPNPAADIAQLKSMDRIIQDAKQATEKEQRMTLLEGIKLYPKAIAWSVLISTCIVMEGYDISLVSNFYAFLPFNKKYGEQLPNGDWQVPAPWQAGLSNVRCRPQ